MPDNTTSTTQDESIGDLLDTIVALVKAGRRDPRQAQRDRIAELEADVTQLREALDAAEQTESYLRGALAKTRESAPATPKDLSDAVRGINDVVMLQLQFTAQAGSGAQRAVDIRRRQLAKYTPAHDAEHGWYAIVSFAAALIRGRATSNDPQWIADIKDADGRNGTAERLLHAAALLMAAYDARESVKDGPDVPYPSDYRDEMGG